MSLAISDVFLLFSLLDVDECSKESHTCDDAAECINTHGAYTCKCLPGYTGDGYDCSGLYTQCTVCVQTTIGVYKAYAKYLKNVAMVLYKICA